MTDVKMSEQSENISLRVCRVSFLCKMCGVLFKSVSTYCTHKVENHHSLEFIHNKSLVFEESESNLEPNDNEPGPGFDTVVENDWQSVQLNDLVPFELKQEPPAAPVIFSSDDDTVKSTANSSIINHVNLLPLQNDDSELEPDEPTHISGFKTEWVEDTIVIYETPSQNKDPLIENPNHGQVDKVDEGSDPLEDFDITQSSQSTSTLTTTEMEHEYFNKNTRDSDDDIICLDDPPLQPSKPHKIASATGSTATATSASNSFILSQLKLQCHICSKQFTSSAQLGIHVSICELYNGKIKELTAEPKPTQPPAAVSSRIRSRSRNTYSSVEQKSSYSKHNNFVNCKECSTQVRRCNLIAHLRTDHKIFVEDSDRKFVCQSCGSAFRWKHNLQRHARVHSDERPFVCSFPDCYQAFKADETLKHHQKTNHPQIFEML